MNQLKHKLLMIVIIIIMAFTAVSCDKSSKTEAANEKNAINNNSYSNHTEAAITAEITEIPANNEEPFSDNTNISEEADISDEDNIAEEDKKSRQPVLSDTSQITDKSDTADKPAATDKAQYPDKPASNDITQASDNSAATDKTDKADNTANAEKAQATKKPANTDKPKTTEKPKVDKTPAASDKAKDSAKSDKDVSTQTASDTTKNTDKKDELSEKKIVAIDAGHQRKGNYDKEPIGPGAKTTKAKVSSGTQGVYTRVPEYELNLVVAKKVKEELINKGYEVVMIRETHDVDLSNKERADIANDSGADIFIRIHANGSTNPSVNGTSTLYPSKKNPYVADLSDASLKLSQAIVDAICENTGSKNRGAVAHDDMSGINWSKIPVTIIEMGYMTNEREDKLMQTEDYQNKIVQGICDGIDDYFSK